MDNGELLREQEYTRYVQSVLLKAIENNTSCGEMSISAIKQLLADAWEELRLKPTALSEQDMQQIAGEVDRYLARKAFNDDLSSRYRRMLNEPFFGRVDFTEDGGTPEKTVIGLYSLPGPDGSLLVHDWRAPVCSLYYDDMPGSVQYESPSGTIKGELTLKRQYKMKDGRLEYYVNTDMSIDDSVLLDILSGATQTHIRQIVATIQAEQSRAIRAANDKLLSVVGGAGSGKTSVAMHRAAFLMYRYRNKLDARRMVIISPSTSFSEYISGVLPELGEENALTLTMHKLLSGMLPGKTEAPLIQNEMLLDAGLEERRRSVRFKSGAEFLRMMRGFIKSFGENGPDFSDILLNGKPFASKSELTQMYRSSFALLSPAQKLERINSVLESRLERLENALVKQYSESLSGRYSGGDLNNAAHFSASQQLSGVRRDIRAQLTPNPAKLYIKALEGAPEDIRRMAEQNAEVGLIWWEDAPAMALLLLELGFIKPDRTIRHIIADEAQDYTACAIAALGAYYSLAHVTLLGDPKQRTCPGQPPLDVKVWNECLKAPDAPVLQLSRCYRSTLNITRLCNAILPDSEQVQAFGREGAMPEILVSSDSAVLEAVEKRISEGYKSIAVVTRTLKEANRLSLKIPHAHLLDGSDSDILHDPGDIAVGGYHLMKGLEYDAVIVVWPEAKLTDGERRRLYTACSRALHSLTLMAGEKMIKELGIIL